MTSIEARTIFALSSGAPPAAIAIVRISGPAAGDALRAVAGRIPEPRYASLATLRDPADGEMLDRALLLWFPAPGSATGEDLAELHLHGGRAVVAAVLNALSRLRGLRTAEPGEFTRRAVEHGRLDLLQAEALADLLTAETESQRRAAISGAAGHLGRRIDRWRRELVSVAAAVEADLAFSDEDDTVTASHDISATLGVVLAEIAEALAMPPSERLREGARIVIAGPPNAGKSTLFNLLAGREAAIVSSQPGTTRDVIEAPIDLAGIPVLLCDTAGLRESDDQVEALGISRAADSIATSDILLWLGDADAAPAHERRLVVATKSDVRGDSDPADHRISSFTGDGIPELKETLVRSVTGCMSQLPGIVLSQRQRGCAEQIADHISLALASNDALIRAEYLRRAIASIDKATGRDQLGDVFDAIFARFCIGK